jgi:prolyl oligopeptidase
MHRSFTYPPTRRDDVVDDYHGALVPDPYRWLETDDAPAIQSWTAAQNGLTRRLLDALPDHKEIHARLTALWNYVRVSAPLRRGTRYFFTQNDGLQNQAVLYRLERLDGEPAPLIDPNALSEDGTVALINQNYSRDGRFLAYSLAQSGSDWNEIHVRDVDRGADTGDVIRWVKFSSAPWLPDNSGFFYARYPAPGEMAGEPPSTHQRVYFHALGTAQADDTLIYARPDARDLGFEPHVTDDGRYLILHVWEGTDRRNRFYYCDLAGDGEFVRLIDTLEARYEFIANDGPLFYFNTDLEAPNGRIIAINIENPARDQWREIISDGSDVIDFSLMVNGRFVLAVLHHAHHKLYIYRRDGTLEREIGLPTLGAIWELSGKPQDTELFINFQSFLYPPTILRYDFTTAELTLFHQPQVDFDPAQFITRQIFFTSKDGTRVPMFLTHKKDLAHDGNNPTLLYGYGGFSVNLPPVFNPTRLLWLERGGVYAQANLRGGNEYGEEWHAAGMLANKQNVFDDFISAADWLISSGYTKPARLAIEGRSNGGLLVAACMLQRPDLFGAVHCAVPVTDMLRYHKFTAGRYWTPEYGNAEENAEHFAFLLAYSPAHNVRPGATHPPILITTADTDDRVVPMHARKLAAALQSADNEGGPTLLRVETRAGHGLGKPTGKLIDEATDVYSFLWEMVGGEERGARSAEQSHK